MKKNHLLLISLCFAIRGLAQPSGNPFTQASFIPKTDLQTGIYPHCVLLADFNGDGKNDLFVSRSSSNSVSAFLNSSTNGNVSFAAQADFPATGNSHEGAATGDLDGDGKPDVVVTNSVVAGSVSVFRNNSSSGNISFEAKQDYPVSNSPYAVAIGDLDGDAKPDLVVANTGSNVLTIYINKSVPGAISFDTGTELLTGTNPYSVAIVDLDGDGKAEIAVTTQGTGSSLSVMKNNSAAGALSFSPPVDFATLSGSFIVSAADLDGDGKPDLAAASSSSNTIVVIRNSSSPGTISFGAAQAFTTGNYPVCVVIADLDGDGKPDLVSANRFTNNISALRNSGTIGNISFDPHVDYAVGEAPLYVAVGDLDGDGLPDITAANSSASAVSILRNIIGLDVAPGIRAFTPLSGISGTTVKIIGSHFIGATSVQFGGVEAASFTIFADTGILAVVGPGASGDVQVTTGYGTAVKSGFLFNGPSIAGFSPTMGTAGMTVEISGLNLDAVTAVQFGGTPAASFVINSATKITATIGTGSSGSISVSGPNGAATKPGFRFGAAPGSISMTPLAGPVGTTVTITGSNFSTVPAENIVFFGAVQAQVLSATDNQLRVMVPAGATYEPVSVTVNHFTVFTSLPFIASFPADDASISDSSFIPAGNFATGTYPAAVAISDLNGDGKPDLVIANSVGNNISVLENKGSAGNISFKTKMDLTSGPDPKRIAIGDLDGDGKPDIVVTDFNSGNASSISVFRNTSDNGVLSFAAKTDYASGNGSIGLAIADMNGDGRPDIIVASGNSGIFSIFKNITTSPGSIAFDPKLDQTSLDHPDNIATADLDKDGKPDLIVANFSGKSISIFRNSGSNGNISFAPGIQYAVGDAPTSVSTGDLDDDGKLDLIVGNYSSGSISLYKNLSDVGNISLGFRQDSVLSATNISVADLNGDGKPDLCTGIYLTGNISVLQNNYSGAGSLSFASAVNFTTGNYDTYTAVGDLDGDGKPEVVAVNALLNTVSILRNKIADPVITAFSDTAGLSGKVITLTGKGFTGATTVSFGGTSADSFKVISSTRIDAVIGAGSSGNITVVTPSGAGTIPGFRFIPEISATESTTICRDGFVMLHSSAAENNQWYKDAVAVGGARSNTFRAEETGMYTLTTTANGITTSSASSIKVTVLGNNVPVISLNDGNVLESADTAGYQWYFNGNIIEGADGQTYLPKQNGIYTTKITTAGCESGFSNPLNFSFAGTVSLDSGHYIRLYPNPVAGDLNLTWDIEGMPSMNILVTSMQGEAVLLKENMQSGATINLAALPPGYYLVKIYRDDAIKVNKTIKILKLN